MATKLEAAAKAWRDVSPKDRADVLIATGRLAAHPTAHNLALHALALAADVEPVTRRKRARKAAAQSKAARKSRALKAVRT